MFHGEDSFHVSGAVSLEGDEGRVERLYGCVDYRFEREAVALVSHVQRRLTGEGYGVGTLRQEPYSEIIGGGGLLYPTRAVLMG